MSYKIMVITSCTGEKIYKPDVMLTWEDFKNKEAFSLKSELLQQYKVPAVNMYTGAQHRLLTEGIRLYRTNFGSDSIDLKIVSAGFGLLNEEDMIIPYEVTFSNMRATEIKQWAHELNLHNDLEKAVEGYDIIFIALGKNYLRALNLPIVTSQQQKVIFLASDDSCNLIPKQPNHYVIKTGSTEAKIYRYGLIGLKGYLFRHLCRELVEEPQIIEKIYDDPSYITTALAKYRVLESGELFDISDLPEFSELKKKKNKESAGFNAPFNFIVKESEFAANFKNGKSLKYFIPEWDDRVDPDFNFITDTHNRDGKKPIDHDVYAHQIYETPNYDGVLMSLAVLGNTKIKQIEECGVHKYIRISDQYPIMADCGAFDYVKSELPPFTTDEVLEKYENLGFNYGVSVDHLIVGPFLEDEKVRNKRYEITQTNASEFIKKYQQKQYSFKPIGVAQGWDPDSYYYSVKKLIELGYQYIALGSLIPKSTRQIYEILKKIAPIVPDYLDIHLFGVARPEGIKAFYQLGATSFDSASPLRRAWLGAQQNYFTLEQDISELGTDNNYKKYAAIRMPYISEKDISAQEVAELKQLERTALVTIREFGKHQTDLETTLQSVINYEKESRETNLNRLQIQLSKKGVAPEKIATDIAVESKKINNLLKQHESLYREVLEERPWEKCDCKICKEIGIEVMIFRGNNRNRRRGFHNTYIFKKQVEIALK